MSLFRDVQASWNAFPATFVLRKYRKNRSCLGKIRSEFCCIALSQLSFQLLERYMIKLVGSGRGGMKSGAELHTLWSTLLRGPTWACTALGQPISKKVLSSTEKNEISSQLLLCKGVVQYLILMNSCCVRRHRLHHTKFDPGSSLIAMYG